MLTADLPGIGGRIKQRPEDFLVEEIPAYAPSGRGEHVFLFVEKRGLSTMEVARRLARHFGVREQAVGYAGLKDKNAITRQVFSVHAPGKTAEDFPQIADPKIVVLWADQHENKLRTGHLKGNRFSIRVRGVRFSDARAAGATLERLAAQGAPNRVGEQRFGLLGNNHLIGLAMVLGEPRRGLDLLLGRWAERPDLQPGARADYAAGRFEQAARGYPPTARSEILALRALASGAEAARALEAVPRRVRRYYLSALQSAAFNAVLDERVRAGTLGKLVEGDVAYKHENGAVFGVDGPTADDPATAARAERLEISPSGPMWGPKMKRAAGVVDRAELAALEGIGVPLGRLEAYALENPGAIDGTRRPLRVPVIDPEIEGGADELGQYVRCAFELPRGAFATVVLREIMKPEPGASLDAAPEEEA
jgi:tRNA pseudouridine13 synthase